MKTIILLLCIIAFGVAHADPVTVMVSQPGQDKVVFLTQVAQTLRTFTNHSGFEACGGVATDGQRYGVAISTSNSHVGCAIDTHNVPDGMHYVGETIHSHSRQKLAHLSEQDLLFTGGNSQIIRTDADYFSANDYAIPGYLAGRSALFYQHGEGTQQRVSSW